MLSAVLLLYALRRRVRGSRVRLHGCVKAAALCAALQELRCWLCCHSSRLQRFRHGARRPPLLLRRECCVFWPAARDREGISSLAAAFAPECRRRVSSKHLITSPRRGLASSAGGDGGAASEAALNLLLGNCTQNRSQCCRSGCPGVRKNESLGDLQSNKQPYLGTLCACAALESPARQILVALFKAVLWVRLRRCWPEIWLRLLRKNPNPSPHTRILEYSRLEIS